MTPKISQGFDASKLPEQIVIDSEATDEQWKRLFRAFERIGEGMAPHDAVDLYRAEQRRSRRPRLWWGLVL